MKVIVDNQIDISKWNEIVRQSKFSNPFQTPEMFSFYEQIPEYKPFLFAIEDDDKILGLVLGVVIAEAKVYSILTRRAIIEGGVLLNCENEIKTTVLELLLDSLYKSLKKKAIYIEIRNYFDYSPYNESYILKKWKFLPYLNITINVKGKSFTKLIAEMKYNRRREIRLTQSNHVFYRTCESEQELESLFLILKDLYKTRVKKPLPNINFFKTLWNSKLGKIFLVIHNEKVIGGSFCIILDGFVIYTLYYCGLRNYNKKIFPTHLAVLAALEYAESNKYHYLDFMGAGLRDSDYGVRKYKLGFGGEINDFGRYRKVLKPIYFIIGKFGIFIKSKIK